MIVNNDILLRPTRLENIVGLEDTKKRLAISIAQSKKRGEPLGHTIISGTHGHGKSSLCECIANELGVRLATVNASTLKGPRDLFQTFKDMEYCGTLHLEEAQSLPRSVETFLLTVMEQFRLDMLMGGQRIVCSTPIEPFTLLASTTDPGKLSLPFKSRFRINEQLKPYSDEEIAQIISINAKKLSIGIQDDAVKDIAFKSRRNPRLSVNHLMWIRDYVNHHDANEITVEYVNKAMGELGMDELGLLPNDRKYLSVLFYNFSGGPAGVKAIANSLGIAEETVIHDIEPYLLENKYLIRGNSGRQLTSYGFAISKDIYTKSKLQK